MTVTLAEQATILLGCVLAGVVMGVLYDVFRITRRIVKVPVVLLWIEDILFWLLSSILLFFAIFWLNDGLIRFYQFLGVAVGLCLYMLTLSGVVVSLCVTVYKLLRTVVLFLFKLLMYPVRFILWLLGYPARFVGRKSVELARYTRATATRVTQSAARRTAASLHTLSQRIMHSSVSPAAPPRPHPSHQPQQQQQPRPRKRRRRYTLRRVRRRT